MKDSKEVEGNEANAGAGGDDDDESSAPSVWSESLVHKPTTWSMKRMQTPLMP